MPIDGEHADALTTGEARGRGAQLNPANRFEDQRLHVLGEHLDEIALEHPDGRQVPTRVYRDRARTIINPVDSPDIPLAWTVNPYRGCEHGCIYCYARPTHETFGLSSGLDFETRLFAKTNAATLLRKELSHPRWCRESIMMSGITDPYQPVESELRITRACLEVFAECRQPVSIITKNAMVLRDLDLLTDLAAHDAAHVSLSITTLDNDLARRMEPRASSPKERLRAVRELSAAGIPVMVMTAPIIPALNDHEIPKLLEAAAEAGAVGAGYVFVRLPYQNKALFLDWLKREYPERAAHVVSQLMEARDGKLSDSAFGRRMRGTGVRADQIARTFKMFARRFKLDQPRRALSSASFRPPGSDHLGQMNLFGT
jgi:DNA repair photolyase